MLKSNMRNHVSKLLGTTEHKATYSVTLHQGFSSINLNVSIRHSAMIPTSFSTSGKSSMFQGVKTDEST